MLKIGMIGAGGIAENHCNAFEKINGVCLAAVCDIVKEKAIVFADKYNIPYYTDYKQMVNKEKPDIILINLPHGLHKEAAVYCINKGIHVFIEKPMANTVEECMAIIDAANRMGVKVAVGHLQRYFNENRLAKEIIDLGKYGKIVSIVDNRTINYFTEQRPEWFFSKKQAGGGIMMNFGAHSLDRLKFLTDREITDIYGVTFQHMPDIEVEGNAQILVKLGQDCSAVINFCGYTATPSNETTIYLERATVYLETGVRVRLALPDEEAKVLTVQNPQNTFVSMWNDYIDAISNNTVPVLSAEYAMDIIRNIETVYSQNEN